MRQPAEPEVLFSAPLPGHGGAGRRRTGPYAGRAHPRWGRPFSFAGAEFQILQTPGHSVGHISTLTPDRVCYVGDALLSREQLDAKLPYCLSHRMGMESREKLRGLDCDLVVMAHRGIARREELEGLIDANQALALRRAGEILA